MSLNTQRIESAQNPKLKRLNKWVCSPPARLKAESVAWCEGLHLATEILDKAPQSVQEIWLPDSLWNNSEWQGISWKADSLPMFEVPNSLSGKLSQQASPSGPTIVFKPKALDFQIDTHTDLVVLDNIQDPGNLGTMLRTCAAAGIRQVALTEGCAWPWGDKALRAGMGAQWSINLIIAPNPAQLGKMPVLATHLSDHSKSLFELDLRQPTVWVFGNEGQGVSADWVEQANHAVRIPQATAVESLNVAASCAIALFEQRRQRLT